MNFPDFFKRLDVTAIDAQKPSRFTFPFYYDPHPWALAAAGQLMQYLEKQQDFSHNFGLDSQMDGLVIGKMFGVLVVETQEGELGYLQAVSGKLANSNHHAEFVPPVFDMLTEGSFFLTGEKEVHNLTIEIEAMETASAYLEMKEQLKTVQQQQVSELKRLKQEIALGKKRRDSLRKFFGDLSETEREIQLELLRKESIREQYFLKDFQRQCKAEVEELSAGVEGFEKEINDKKEERRQMSNNLQQRLFEQYAFLNTNGAQKSLLDIFVRDLNIIPPAGSGECAAPKLLQYAFRHQLKPIALAEFWWGASPASEVRKHGNFYPACRGKCEPILGHMLSGIETDENPLLSQPAAPLDLDIVYEDEVLVVVNKPAEFLSVPGINLKDSVYQRARNRFPDATGPLIVHRLDMSTSGLMVIAKTEDAYHRLQKQFIRRTVKKRYVALLDGEISVEKGVIDLPLRVDLDDRPRQLVCYEHGKRAVTEFEIIERREGKTLIHFYPVTGRTHQLRVHSSHASGLNAPIVGDDLYGIKSDRLHLHAERLEFVHPANGERVIFEVKAAF